MINSIPNDFVYGAAKRLHGRKMQKLELMAESTDEEKEMKDTEAAWLAALYGLLVEYGFEA
jgi:hypothetical protein